MQKPMTPTVKERVEELENKNVVSEEKALSERTITVKEIYERLILLEGKLEAGRQEDKVIATRFTQYIAVIFFLILLDVVLSLYMIIR